MNYSKALENEENFIDANVIIDYLDASSKDHSAAVDCMRIIRKHFGKPVVSPITFFIADFLLGKFARNRQWHKDKMKSTFSTFDIIPIYQSSSTMFSKVFLLIWKMLFSMNARCT